MVSEALFLPGGWLWPKPECDLPLLDLKELEKEKEREGNPLISPGAAVTPSQSAKPRMTLGTSRGPVRTFHFRPALEKSQLGLQHEYINVVYPLSPRRLLRLRGLRKSRLPSKNIRWPSQVHCHVGLCGVYVYRALDTAST